MRTILIISEALLSLIIRVFSSLMSINYRYDVILQFMGKHDHMLKNLPSLNKAISKEMKKKNFQSVLK